MIPAPISANDKPKRPALTVVISEQRLWGSSSFESETVIP